MQDSENIFKEAGDKISEIFILDAEENGENYFVILKVNYDKLLDFYQKVSSDEDFEVTEYGEILYKDTIEPTPEILEKLQSQYQISPSIDEFILQQAIKEKEKRQKKNLINKFKTKKK